MKISKHIVKFLLLLAVFVCSTKVFAYEIKDIKADYWASREIAKSLVNGYMTVDKDNNFNPEAIISRSDFVDGLLKALKETKTPEISEEAQFKDINKDTKNLKSIISAKELQMIYGYPDETFKPEAAILRTEASSILGHISKGEYFYTGILETFDDASDIPHWAVLPTAKAVKYDFYINHPNKKLFRPNDKLTRAEAAVLYDKVSSSLDLIDPKYRTDLITKIPDIFLRSETLSINDKATSHQVDIYDTKNVIKAGNIIKATFETPLNYKVAKIGDIVEFSLPQNIVTDQGTTLFDTNAKIKGIIREIKPSIWRDKNSFTLLVLDVLELPDGKRFGMNGVPLTREYKFLHFFTKTKIIQTKDKKQDWLPVSTDKKPLSEADFLTAYSRRVSPKLKYDIKMNEKKPKTEIYVLLTEDLVIRHLDKEKL